MALLFSILVYIIAAAVMLYLAVKDIRERRVPNKVLLFLVALWVVWRAVLAIVDPRTLATSVFQLGFALVALSGLVAVGAIYERLRKKPAMGGGDVKLIAVLALYLGMEGLAVCVIVACMVGLVYALAARVRRDPMRFGIPFATCLSCGMFLTFLLL